MRPRLGRLLGSASVLLAIAACPAPAAAGSAEYSSVRRVLDPADSGGRLDIRDARFGQLGRDLSLDVRTGQTVRADELSGARTRLCVYLFDRSGPARTAVCFRTTDHAFGLWSARLDPAGAALGWHRIAAGVHRDGKRGLQARFPSESIGLRHARFRWQAVSSDASTACAGTPGVCLDAAPARPVAAAVVAVHPVGCVVPRPGLFFHGPRRERAVALTFDDGPSAYTSRFLGVLEREHVPATFFLIGQQVRARRSLLRRVLRDGGIVGNHSWNHADLARSPDADGQLTATNRAIRRATGFEPCLFRAPYGALSSGLIGAARSRALSTIQWDVDPTDWALPGAGAIYSRIVGSTRSGSIVLMHDGGGPREQGLQALPLIIHRLRARGFRFETVTDLLGGRVLYGRQPGA